MNPLSFDHSLRLARGHRSTRVITPSPTFFVRIVVRLRRPIRTTSDNRESSQGPPPPGLGFKKGGRESLLSLLLRQFRRQRGAPSCILWDERRIFTRTRVTNLRYLQHFPTLGSGYRVLFTYVYEYGGFFYSKRRGKVFSSIVKYRIVRDNCLWNKISAILE